MLRNDGHYKIYVIQHKSIKYAKKCEWTFSNLDVFGSPPGFTASDPCWQETGIIGTFDLGVARGALHWIRFHKRHPWNSAPIRNSNDHLFRVVCVVISQSTLSVLN